jgi:phosphoribosylaminoimidazole-succinocarboxamide synthase
MQEPLLRTNLKGRKVKRGKVRDIYDMDDGLLIVATDRISAFDCVMPNGIPGKGKILTQISLFWFDRMKELVENHLISSDARDLKDLPEDERELVRDRFMLVRKAEVIPVECVVRGYLAGSGWKSYRETGQVCGIALPEGLKQASRLPEPIFTPATKAASGHDENISLERMAEIAGRERADYLVSKSIEIYKKAADYALKRGIIISDTKFEWGVADGKVILIDELLTPDSSRFWPLDSYREGTNPPSFDKQFVRDYLERCDWNKEPPAPELPEEIVGKTRQKYMEAYQKLAGGALNL